MNEQNKKSGMQAIDLHVASLLGVQVIMKAARNAAVKLQELIHLLIRQHNVLKRGGLCGDIDGEHFLEALHPLFFQEHALVLQRGSDDPDVVSWDHRMKDFFVIHVRSKRSLARWLFSEINSTSFVVLSITMNEGIEVVFASTS